LYFDRNLHTLMRRAAIHLPSAYVSIRQHTSAYSRLQLSSTPSCVVPRYTCNHTIRLIKALLRLY
jgi:hypothetical protein